MYKLFCDKCKREIRFDEPVIEIEAETFIYKGGCDLFQNNSGNTTRLKMCSHCTALLEDFLNLENRSADF